MNVIANIQQEIDDDKVGKFYCVYCDTDRYWGKLCKVNMLIIPYYTTRIQSPNMSL